MCSTGFAVGISLLSLTIAGLTTFRTVLFQRDDIRFVVGDSLRVTRDKTNFRLDEDQEFTFINSGNRQAVISGLWGQLVLVTDPNAQCDNRFFKSIFVDASPIVLKPGDIQPLICESASGVSMEKGKRWAPFPRRQRGTRLKVPRLRGVLCHDTGQFIGQGGAPAICVAAGQWVFSNAFRAIRQGGATQGAATDESWLWLTCSDHRSRVSSEPLRLRWQTGH